MKIMWLCNTPLPEVYNVMHIKGGGMKEGWLAGISNELRRREEVDLYYVFPQENVQRTINVRLDNISFRGYYRHKKHHSEYITDQRNEDKLKNIIDQIKPDIIHIFGTEMQHTLECIHAVADKYKVIISIQGLVSECSKYYCDGIPLRNILNIKICCGGWDSILRGRYQFFRRGINEKKSLRSVKYVIGRTEWDKACITGINSSCKYYYCSETLREIFYQKCWDMREIEQYSIFVSQGDYPIKGLHTLFYAMPHILNRFPDTNLYIAGDDSFLDNTAYGKYIKKLIRKLKLNKAVHFLGFISGKGMCGRMQKSHVMVLPSNCENSPNSVGEAMLVGLPVIASNVGGVSSVAHHGWDALLFDSCDVKRLVKYVGAIFSDNRLAQRLSVNGKVTAAKLYDRKKNIERLMEIYGEINRENGENE